jgi:hypothetical protein
MDDFQDKLNSVLGNPEMMQQIMAMAQSMGNATPQSPPIQPAPATPDLDLNMLQKISGFANQAGTDANQQSLLKALRPYLGQDRLGRLEKAMRAAKMAKLAGSLLSSGLLTPR